MASLAAGVPGISSLASTMLLGKGDQSCMLAGRLAKKLNKQFFYCSARQPPAQNASTQRHGQPALTD